MHGLAMGSGSRKVGTHDLEELVLTHRVVPSEPIDGLEDVSAHQLLASLQPAAEAQARADVGRVLMQKNHAPLRLQRDGKAGAAGLTAICMAFW